MAQFRDWGKEEIEDRRAKLLVWARERWAVDLEDVASVKSSKFHRMQLFEDDQEEVVNNEP